LVKQEARRKLLSPEAQSADAAAAAAVLASRKRLRPDEVERWSRSDQIIINVLRRYVGWFMYN
jgi:hypothetical protein